MPKQSFGPIIQERAGIVLNALLEYDPDSNQEFLHTLKDCLAISQEGNQRYHLSQKLIFEVYPCAHPPGRKFITTNYSLVQLTKYIYKRVFSEEQVKLALACLEKLGIVVSETKQGSPKKILTLQYQDKEEINHRFQEACAKWNKEREELFNS